MHESNSQRVRVSNLSRRRAGTPNQVERAVQNKRQFNANLDSLRQNSYKCDAGAGVAESHWKVVVWESQTSRLRLIDRVVSDCGARTYRVEEWDDVEKALWSSCCAAVVALGPYQTDEALTSKVIGRMKQAGLTVVAHERGAQSWSVGLRCRVLLAGASCVLDSDESGFSRELRRVMTEVMAHKMRESSEKERKPHR